jgi:hypothetical protein
LPYTCPLCHQPVSVSVYNRITGIWKEKAKLVKEIREDRRKQLEKFRKEKAKLRAEALEFRHKRKEIIEQAIARKTSKLERKLVLSAAHEQKVEERAKSKIEKLESSARERAERIAQARLSKYKRESRASMQVKIKAEKERAIARERTKNAKLQRSFKSALTQMKAKSSEIDKQRKQIADLQKQLEKQTTPQIEGLLYERNLVRELKRHFPKDEIVHKGKGGDILQYVREDDGHQAGLIVYECKRVKHYNSKHITQALTAKEQRKGDFAILVTNSMRRNTYGFFTEKEVLVVHATGVLALAAVLRKQIIQIASLKLGQLERDKAVRMTLDYIEGPEFTNSLEAIIGETINLHKELIDEVKKHISTWKKRYNSYYRIHSHAFEIKATSKAVLSGEMENKHKLAKPVFPALVELPDLDKRESTTELVAARSE